MISLSSAAVMLLPEQDVAAEAAMCTCHSSQPQRYSPHTAPPPQELSFADWAGRPGQRASALWRQRVHGLVRRLLPRLKF